jgi:hypothetical protein
MFYVGILDFAICLIFPIFRRAQFKFLQFDQISTDECFNEKLFEKILQNERAYNGK